MMDEDERPQGTGEQVKQCPFAHDFKNNPGCGYSGVETYCDGSFSDCVARGNERRFGGYIGPDPHDKNSINSIARVLKPTQAIKGEPTEWEVPICWVSGDYPPECGTKTASVRVWEMLGWLATGFAVAGVVLNNNRLWPCFVLWMISNALSAAIHYRRGPKSLLVRDLIFFALAGVGLWQWTR